MKLREWVSVMTARAIRAVRPQRYPLDSATEARERQTGSALTRPPGQEPVRVPIAGVMHSDHCRSVRSLILAELVRLRRDLESKHDSNAIKVETGNGQQLGYVPRNIAAKLAPYMDGCRDPLDAAVTELTSDIQGGRRRRCGDLLPPGNTRGRHTRTGTRVGVLLRHYRRRGYVPDAQL